MPINEYDQPVGQKYISTYIPMPLNQLNDLAKDYSDRYHTGKALAGEVDRLSEGIKAAPYHAGLKQAVVGDYNSQISGLVDSMRPEDWVKPEFQEKMSKVIRNFRTDPRVGTLQNSYNWWDKEGQKYFNSDDYNRNINLTNLKNPDGSWKQVGDDVQSVDHIKYEDHIPDVKNIMDGITVDGYSLNQIQKDGSGYFVISNGQRKGISADKVEAVASSNIGNYANTKGGSYRFAEALSNMGLDPRIKYNEFMLNDKIPDKAKQAINAYLQNDLQSYGNKQIHSIDDINKTMKTDTIGAMGLDGNVAPGLPQTAPNMSDLENITTNVPDRLKGMFSVDTNGNVKIDYSKSYFKTDYQTYDKYGKPDKSFANFKDAQEHSRKIGGTMDLKDPKKTAGMSDDMHKELYKAADNAAKAIGWKGPVDTKNYEQIFTEYNGYSKNVSPQEILDGADRDMTTEDLIKDRENYTFKDQDGVVIPDDKMPFLTPKNFAATARTTKNGKVELKANYMGENGKVQRFVVEPHGSQYNSYYSTTGRLKEDAQTFFRTGELSKGAKQSTEVINQALKNSGVSLSSDPNVKPISFQPIPGSPGEYMVASSTTDDRKNVTYNRVRLDVKRDSKGNPLYEGTGKDKKPVIIVTHSDDVEGGLDGAVQTISKDWFTKTPEGRRKASSLLGGNKKFEFLLGLESDN